MTPIRANIVGPPDVATKTKASTPACHSGVKSCPDGPEVQLPLYPRKRSQVGHRAMSEKCQEETHALHQIVSLFDQVVGSGEEGRWEIQPDGLRGVEI